MNRREFIKNILKLSGVAGLMRMGLLGEAVADGLVIVQAGGATTLVGAQPGSFSSSVGGQIDRTYLSKNDAPYTAVATGTATYGYWYFGTGTLFVTGARMLIYDSSKNWLATSDEQTSFAQNSWIQFHFTAGPTITASNGYYIGIIANNTFPIGYTGSTVWELAYDGTTTYPTPSDPFPAGTNVAADNIGAYITD